VAFASIQLRSLLKEICKVMGETFPKSIKIVCDLGSGLPEVSGDPTQLHQVFTNLMINARDAMPEGGRLTVEARRETVEGEWAARHPPAREGIYIRIRFQDTGTGMTDEVRERIFDPFFSTKAPGKGTGLGLSTSLGILHAHDGFLVLETAPGEGSTFDVYLPEAVSGREAVQRVERPEPPRGRGERILVVDDEEAVRFMLNGTLSAMGYEVDLVENGARALERLEAPDAAYDLILLDMMMPEMDGAAFMRRARESLDRLPQVLLISGMVEEESLRATGLDLQSHFLAKPFTVLEMASKIRVLLDSGL
jgi:CheY-like chemotaxis protein